MIVRELFRRSQSQKPTRNLMGANRVLEATGEGYAFSLDCSPHQIAAAQRNPKGFVDHFKRRIDRELKRVLGSVPRYAFGVDIAVGDRLHIHGALAANDNQLEAMNNAFCNAGGKWANKRHRNKQCKIEPLYTPDIWASYCVRRRGRVKRLIRGSMISITNPLRNRAKELWSVLCSS